MIRSTCDEAERSTTREESQDAEHSLNSRALAFSQIPHTTRLFLDFLEYAPPVPPFFPHSIDFNAWVRDEAKAIRYPQDRREQVCAVLDRQNREWGASPKTLANIDRLRKGAMTVVTGQQVGLFGGPAFCLYKALTAVKLAEQASSAGVDAVPIFWLATYDHDLAEVNHVSIPGQDGLLQTLTTTTHGIEDSPVGALKFGGEITELVEQAALLLGETQATEWLRSSYRRGETLGTAFARLYAQMFAEWGVIVLDVLDPELHRIASPVYRAAVEKSEELASALLARGKELESAGYHQQVKVTESSVLVFALENGARLPVHRRKRADKVEFVIGDSKSALSGDELLSQISSEPERFTPNVLLRPVVQDYVLPTLTYVGGSAEVAYFAQCSVLYSILAGRVTPIVPRFSATLLEAKQQRMLEKKNLSLADIFEGPEALRWRVSAKSLPVELLSAFDTASASMADHMAAIKEKIALLDPTLVDAVQTAASKTQYQLEKLKAQAARAEAQKTELIGRYVESLSQLLYPNKGLQERTLGAIYFVARYGPELLRRIYDLIPTNNLEHQIVEL